MADLTVPKGWTKGERIETEREGAYLLVWQVRDSPLTEDARFSPYHVAFVEFRDIGDYIEWIKWWFS